MANTIHAFPSQAFFTCVHWVNGPMIAAVAAIFIGSSSGIGKLKRFQNADGTVQA